MTALTLLFEGKVAEVEKQEKYIYNTAVKYGGLAGGEESGRKGYAWTHMICYIRDIVANYRSMAESLECTVSWGNLLPLLKNMTKAVEDEAAKRGIPKRRVVL